MMVWHMGETGRSVMFRRVTQLLENGVWSMQGRAGFRIETQNAYNGVAFPAKVV